MDEKYYDALEVCLNALETGADLESVLKRFPGMEDDLRPLLETAHQASMLAIAEVPEAALRRGKSRVLQHAAGMRESASITSKRRAIFSFPRLAISLAIALLFFFSGTGLVRASDGALPGDNLYPVKRTLEDVRLLLVFNPESREELEDEFELERLEEVDELLAEGRHETITFAGLVTEQNGDFWIVSNVPVKITPDSQLPEAPVALGASVMVQGRTNAQGFVEAERVELLGSNVILPASVPTEMESEEDNSGQGSSGDETEDHSGQDYDNSSEDEEDQESSSKGNDGKGDNVEDREGSESGSNNIDEDNSNEDRSGDEIQNEDGNSDGGSDEGDDESYD